MNKKQRLLTDTLLVSINASTNGDETVLLVGRKRLNESVEIVNAFQGKDAMDLYEQLITVKKGE